MASFNKKIFFSVTYKAFSKKLTLSILLFNLAAFTGIWFGVGLIAEKRLSNLIENERNQVRADAQIMSEALNRQVSETKSVPIVLAQDPGIQKILSRFGPSVKALSIPLPERAEACSKDPVLAALSSRFTHIVHTFDLNSVWMTNAAGDTIAEGHASGINPFCGTNYADRDYFKAARMGQNGIQFAVGKVTNKYSLFFSSPVQVQGEFVGMVGANFRMENLLPLIKQVNAFVTDDNGVIILAPDANILMHTVPDAKAMHLDPETLAMKYKRQKLEAMPLSWHKDSDQQDLYNYNQAPGPFLLATHTIEGIALQVYVLRNLHHHFVATRADRIWWFVALSISSMLSTALFGAVVLYLKVTHSQQARLEEQAHHLREAQKIARIGDWEFDFATDIISFSDILLEMNPIDEMPPPYLLNRLMHRYHPDDLQKLQQGMQEALTNREIGHLDVRLLQPDGSYKWFRHVAKIVTDEQGAVTGLVGTTQDIDRDKRLEIELAEARQQAEAASRAKSEFLANMSHEIRTPMNGIMGMAQLMGYTGLNARQTEYLKHITASANDLLSLINNILDLSKIDAGGIELEHRVFSLRESVQEVIITQQSLAFKKDLQISSELPDELPDLLVGDQLRLKQVLLNLLNNAIKFTGHGMISITGTVCGQTEGGVQLELTISDTGVGISPAVIDKIFDPFSQADASTTRRYGGTGLGLSICRQLVSLMGGTLQVASTEGVGSSFTLRIPFLLPATAAEADEPPFCGATDWDGPPLRILLVDDQESNLMFLQQLLEHHQHHVVLARSGREALDRWRAEPFQMILLDLQMPDMDGFEVLNTIRQQERQSGGHLPIIAVTARSLLEERGQILQAGFDGYVSKPVRSDILFAEMKRQLPPPPDELLSVQVVAEFSADPERLATYCSLLLDDLEARIGDMVAALFNGDSEGLAEAAHAAKGLARGLRDPAGATLAQEIEQLAKAGNPAVADEKLSQLRTFYARLRP